MTFAFPLAFLGLLSLPVIIGLHLMRARNRRYAVSSLNLWSFLDTQVRGVRARRLPITWLLLLDLLIAALLTLALANPQVQVTRRGQETRHTRILLDVSSSMAARDEPGSRLDAARAAVLDLLNQPAEGGVITLIAFGDSARIVADTRQDSLETLIERLNALLPVETGADLATGLAFARAAQDPEVPADIHIFTDAAFSDVPEVDPDIPLFWHIFGDSAANQAVLSLSTTRLSPQKVQLFVRFANFGERPVTREAALLADGRLVDTQAISLDAGTTVARTWDLTGSPGSVTVRLEGVDDYPLDDSASTGLQAQNPLSILLAAAGPGPVQQALSALPDADLQVVTPEEYQPGSEYDLWVFSGFLPERWPAGHVLVVDPPPDSILLGTASLQPVRSQPFPRPDPLMVDVDFTGVRWGNAWQIAALPPGLIALASDRQPLVVRSQTSETQIVFLLPEIAGADGSPTPFARHPAFPIIVANAAELARGSGFLNAVHLGGSLPLPDSLAARQVTIQPPAGNPIQFGAERPPSWQPQETGLFRLTYVGPDGVSAGFLFGVNAGDLLESDITPARFAVPDGSGSAEEVEVAQPVSLAAWILGLSALVLVFEAWLAWK